MGANSNSVLFPKELSKRVDVKFDTEAMSSNGGAVLLGALDRGLALTQAVLPAFVDQRDSSRVTHPHVDLLRQRVYGLAPGYEDCNDAERIGGDAAVKLAVGRGLKAPNLASASTLCRFENGVRAREFATAGRALARWRVATLKKRFRKARLVTIDVDSTPDPTHGQQELTFFDGHYDTYCYKPLVVSLSFDQDPEQYLVGLRLRPGKAKDDRALVPLLRRLVSKLRRAFSSARIRVRADAGFGKSPRFLDALDALQVEYALGYQPLQTLQDLAEPVKEEARALHEQGLIGEATQAFGEFAWQPKSGTWPGERRIVVKAEVTHTEGREPRLNVRFVVTRSMGRFSISPRGLYRVYRQRGDSENRVKELKQLQLGRTSCHRFLANALRVLLVALSYMLVQELRYRLRKTVLRRAQVLKLRERLFKLAVRIEESVRRFVLHCPIDFPWLHEWQQAALSIGAVRC